MLIRYPPHSKIQWKTLHSKIKKAPSIRAGTINRNIGLSVDIQKKNDYRYENSKIGYF